MWPWPWVPVLICTGTGRRAIGFEFAKFRFRHSTAASPGPGKSIPHFYHATPDPCCSRILQKQYRQGWLLKAQVDRAYPGMSMMCVLRMGLRGVEFDEYPEDDASKSEH